MTQETPQLQGAGIMRVSRRDADVHSRGHRPPAFAAPGLLTLPPGIGHTDEQAQARLTSKREHARQWMRERGIEDLNDPLPPERLGKEGKQ